MLVSNLFSNVQSVLHPLDTGRASGLEEIQNKQAEHDASSL